MYFKSLICAIAFVLAPLTASAAPIMNGGSYDVRSADIFTGGIITASAGSGSFEADFYTTVDPTNGGFKAAITGGNLSGFDNLTAFWIGSDGITVLDSISISALPDDNSMLTTFTAPNLTQTLRLTWDAATVMSASVNFEVAAVPLPAGGLLLLTALGGLGFARRRKQAA